MKKSGTMLCVVLLSVAMLAGCSWTQKGAAIGGCVGAGVGAAVADESGEGALVGLAAGGLAGALIGDLIEQQNHKNEIASLERQLEASKNAAKELEALKAKYRDLENLLKERDKEIAELRAKLKEVRGEGEKIIVTLTGETHYRPGRAELTPEGKAEIDRAVKIIKDQFPDREICVRGHTDSDPIKYSGWKSNWELGSARALNVLHYMMEKHGIKGEKISASTFAWYRPVASNDTADGKKENRRTEIVILPKVKMEMEKTK